MRQSALFAIAYQYRTIWYTFWKVSIQIFLPQKAKEKGAIISMRKKLPDISLWRSASLNHLDEGLEIQKVRIGLNHYICGFTSRISSLDGLIRTATWQRDHDDEVKCTYSTGWNSDLIYIVGPNRNLNWDPEVVCPKCYHWAVLSVNYTVNLLSYNQYKNWLFEIASPLNSRGPYKRALQDLKDHQELGIPKFFN